MAHYTLLESSLIWLHIILFVFWLGADIGVYIAHRFILDSGRSVEARLTAARILHIIDFFPRVTMALFLASGVSLMAMSPLGEDFRGWPLVLTWLFCLAWTAVTVFLFMRAGGDWPSGGRLGALVETVDRWGKVALVVVLSGIAIYTMVATEPFGAETNPKWLGLKLLLYAVAVAGAVGIELCLLGFGRPFQELIATGSTPQVESELRRSMVRSRPFAYTIWISIALAAFVGLWKPGATF